MKLFALFAPAERDDVDSTTVQYRVAMAFAVGLCVATAALAFLAYAATRQSARGTQVMHDLRAMEALALAHAAVVRDMKGAWVSFLVPLDHQALDEEPPYDLLHRSAQSFAKFPYAEWIALWKNDAVAPRTYLFVRSDRPPRWAHEGEVDDSFPALLVEEPQELSAIMRALAEQKRFIGPYAFIETAIEDVPYQIVAHRLVDETEQHTVSGVVALGIDLDWVRKNYFGPILTQISSIGGVNDAVTFSVTDEASTLVATTGADATESVLQRGFPLLFLDPTALRVGLLPRPPIRDYVLHARPTAGDAGIAAVTGTYGILLLVTLAALASGFALLQTVRAVRGSLTLATMKSEFVSAVTHELKTPLVTIRLIGDTLARGRYAAETTIEDYARLLSKEAARLGESIDHLLTFARYSDPIPPQAMTSVDVMELVDDAVERFRPALAERGGAIDVNAGSAGAKVLIDPRAMTQVLEILVDNAVKYSDGAPSITIRAASEPPFVRISIIDQGIGIHPDDLVRVQERFFRGRNASDNGTGLGLAIASRVVRQNGGELRIFSRLGVGTTVELFLRTGRP